VSDDPCTTQPVQDGWLRRERAELLELLRGLTAEQWSAATECPAWDVKGVALHVLGDDLSLLSRQRDATTPGLFTYAEHHPGLDFRQLLDGFNEQWVTAATFFSTDLVLLLLELSGEWTADFYEHVDLRSLGEPVGFFGLDVPAPYWQIASRELIERWVHQHQIRRAIGAPEMGTEFLAVAGGVFAKAISLRLDDLGAADGTLLGLDVPGVAGWTMRRQDGGWVLAEGLDPAAIATVSFRPDTAVRVFTRAHDLGGADVVSTSGDPQLGGVALTAIVQLFT
jgi:uncharacterized protein (TIGR03083 family)